MLERIEFPFLEAAEEGNVLVDLPSGKLTKTGERKPLSSQKRMSCFFFAARRIAIPTAVTPHLELKKAIKQLKKSIANPRESVTHQIIIADTICTLLKIDPKTIILKNRGFVELYDKYVSTCSDKKLKSPTEFLNGFSINKCWGILFDELINRAIAPMFNLQDSNWHPKQGFNGLMESLKQHGAHVFSGKFGRVFHNQLPVLFASENNAKREVYNFRKGSYDGDSPAKSPWTHCIVVDQAKIINNVEMIAFRDPYDPSQVGCKERIYLMRYTTFIERLTDFQTNRYTQLRHDDSTHFGLVSKSPAKLK